jgi:hypothetical protein
MDLPASLGLSQVKNITDKERNKNNKGEYVVSL